MTCENVIEIQNGHKADAIISTHRGHDFVAGGSVPENLPQPEGSHVHWPISLVGGDYDDEIGLSIHRMKGSHPGASSTWDVRFPNDDWVGDYGVTLEEMQEAGAI